jgi:uncharacterized protein YjiS (DUF1127 family)
MAALDTSRFIYVSTGYVSRFGEILATAIAAVATWNDARVTRNTLSALSNRELDDIGLVRGDIDRLVQDMRHY